MGPFTTPVPLKAAERRCGHANIVEGYADAVRGLRLLMSFAGEYNNVSTMAKAEDGFDRGGAIKDNLSGLSSIPNALQGFFGYRRRIFAASTLR